MYGCNEDTAYDFRRIFLHCVPLSSFLSDWHSLGLLSTSMTRLSLCLCHVYGAARLHYCLLLWLMIAHDTGFISAMRCSLIRTHS
ncbi:hypothetical protein BDN70DRAFT_475563 [Pholiota conissans]|uniref:Uncharacterized protein n=1 Tax=Pholiota conissans TaxID=109636 RepID=A0A9P6CSX1_9AGAR|nr:hypothetical protein BDN70DRAFT_475563 [Pholiota conissans]